jgi:hypothetical protein
MWAEWDARSNVITEENWPEYQSQGFRALDISPADPNDARAMGKARGEAGYWFGKYYTGHAYDRDEGRPLRHKPGVSMYVDPEGIQYYGQQLVKYPEDLHHPDRDIGPAIIWRNEAGSPAASCNDFSTRRNNFGSRQG